MKKIFTLLIAVTMIATLCLFPVSATEAEPAPAEAVVSQEVEETGISPRFVHSYTKTVTKTYGSYTSVPEYIYYEEYNMGSWFSGKLFLKKVELQSNGLWLATYTGLLQGQL